MGLSATRYSTAVAGSLMAVLLAASPLSAEVVSTDADGFVTRDTATVAATPLQTWLALITPGDWWDDQHSWSGDASNMTLVPQAGGCFCETIPGEDGEGSSGYAMEGSAQHATVVQAYPLRVLRMRGGLGPLQGEPASGILTITLKEVEGGTRVLWEYNVGGPMRFEIAEISKAVDGVMSQQLRGLQAHLGALDGAGAAADEGPVDDAAAVTQADPTIEAQIDSMVDSE